MTSKRLNARLGIPAHKILERFKLDRSLNSKEEAAEQIILEYAKDHYK